MRSIKHTLPVMFGTIALSVAALGAQQPAVKIGGSAKLKAEAKVSGEQATATALAQVPNGRIESAEVEREHGKLLYSFDIRTAGKSGIDEVQVDAITGKLLGTAHETPKDERAEARQDVKARKAAHSRKATP